MGPGTVKLPSDVGPRQPHLSAQGELSPPLSRRNLKSPPSPNSGLTRLGTLQQKHFSLINLLQSQTKFHLSAVQRCRAVKSFNFVNVLSK